MTAPASMPIRPLLKTALVALLAACCLAAVWDVRGVFRGFARSAPVALDLKDAVKDQCSVSGGTMVSTGNDAKLVWREFSLGNAYLDIQVETTESTSLLVFWGTLETPSFSPDRRLTAHIFPGRSRITLPLPEEISGIRLDFGNRPDQAFHVRSLVATRGPIRIRPWSWRVFFWRTFLLFFPLFLLASHAFFPAARIWTFLDKHRFSLAACMLLAAVGLDLNGSSLAMWNRYVRNPSAQPPLFGEERPVRSDEWAVFTPMTAAQSFASPPWPYVNDIPRALPTDMFAVYAQPVRHPLLVFRPFLAGHVLFGFPRGLAFFWTARWLALFLAGYALFKLLTEGDKPLSAVSSLLVLFSPVVQWWGAINAFAEMLVFGSWFVLCLDRFLAGGTWRNRCWPAIGMGYSGVAYAMTLYPAAMVPFAWVFGALSLWIVRRRIRDFRPDAPTLGLAAAVAAVCTLCLLWYFRLSSDAFRTLSGTVYPGRRFDFGGGFLKGIALSWGNLFFPWTSPFVEEGNVFNRAVFLDFFPLGFILFAYSSLRRKTLDVPSLLLTAAAVFFGVYAIVGFPAWAARLSLLSRSTPPRIAVALSFVQFLLLVRSLAVLRPKPGFLAAAVVSALFACLAVALSRSAYPTYLTPFRLAVVGLAATAACHSMLRFRARGKPAACFLAALAVAAGAFVNPVQKGDAGVSDSGLARAIRGIVARDRGPWLVEGASFLVNQYPLLLGAPTVNAGNLCPALERWRTIDPEEKEKTMWNRYTAGMRFDLKPGTETTFSLKEGRDDLVHIVASNETVRRLGVSYILTRNDLAPLSDGIATYELLARASDWNIFRVVFPSPDIPSIEPA